jgi:hypothetical protein
LDHHTCSLVLNPVSFTLSTCSTLSTLVSPLIELSSKYQNPQESFQRGCAPRYSLLVDGSKLPCPSPTRTVCRRLSRAPSHSRPVTLPRGGTATSPRLIPPCVATLFFPRRSRKRCPPPDSPPWPRAGGSLSLPTPSPSSSYNTNRG